MQRIKFFKMKRCLRRAAPTHFKFPSNAIAFHLNNSQISQTTAKPGNLNHRIAGRLEASSVIIQRQETAATKAKGGSTVGNKATASQSGDRPQRAIALLVTGG
nr:hypothetical protein [Nostoc sp. SerVER01]